MSNLIETALAAGKNIDAPTTSRKYAVAAALEVIATYAGSGNPKFSLSTQMAQLSTYADQIQAALKVKAE